MNNVPFSLEVAFDDPGITKDANFSFAEAVSVSLILEAPQGGDYRISAFYTTGQIPEPITIALVGLGLAGLGAARRRRPSRYLGLASGS